MSEIIKATEKENIKEYTEECLFTFKEDITKWTRHEFPKMLWTYLFLLDDLTKIFCLVKAHNKNNVVNPRIPLFCRISGVTERILVCTRDRERLKRFIKQRTSQISFRKWFDSPKLVPLIVNVTIYIPSAHFLILRSQLPVNMLRL